MPKIESIKERQADFAYRVGILRGYHLGFRNALDTDSVISQANDDELYSFIEYWIDIDVSFRKGYRMRFEQPNFNLEKELEKWLS